MTKHLKGIILLAVIQIITLGMLSCNSNEQKQVQRVEDQQAKQKLQGTWINDVEGNVAFSFKGDSIYYNDSLTTPAGFYVANDTLYIENHPVVSYPIRRLSSTTLLFVNAEGEEIELIKSTSVKNLNTGEYKGSVSVNQGKKLKKDSVLVSAGKHFHAYTQVNPTTFKVYRQTTNSDGMRVESIFYDNIVYIALYVGQQKVFGKNFKKQDFEKVVPLNYLNQAVLSEIIIDSCKDDGVRFVAVLSIPDSYTNYRVNIDVSSNGTNKISV